MTDIFNKRFEELFTQLEELHASRAPVYNSYLEKHETNIDGSALLQWKVKARSLLSKACGVDSEYYKEFSKNDSTKPYGTYLGTLERLKAIFLAAKEDYQGGYLRATRSLIQAEVFDSELEQASSLLKVGYKSPAAVVAGIVLETSPRELCDQQNIPHGKLDKMNSDLAKAGVYNKLQQKRITALADIRNSAAHGQQDVFSEQDVDNMIRDVGRFVATYV